MILFIIIIVIIVFFFTREEKFKCYVSDKTIKKKSIKSSNIGKVEDNYCMWNNNKCRLPNYSSTKSYFDFNIKQIYYCKDRHLI